MELKSPEIALKCVANTDLYWREKLGLDVPDWTDGTHS